MKKIGIIIGLILVAFAAYGFYHNNKIDQCKKMVATIYQQRVIDAKFDKNPDVANKFANDMLATDMVACQFQ